VRALVLQLRPQPGFGAEDQLFPMMQWAASLASSSAHHQTALVKHPTPAYTFDLAGNLYTATNGVTSTPTVGTLTFTSPFDAAGRLLSISSNWNDAAHPSVLFSTESPSALPCPGSLSKPYTAFGGLMNATYGGGLTLNRGYDVRLRTTCEIDTGGSLTNGTSASATVTVTGTEQVK
jgi:hypothetical protein